MTASMDRLGRAAPVAERRVGPFRLSLIPPDHPAADLEKLVALVGTLGIAALVLLPLEALAPFAGGCTFKGLTGIPCMSCGLTRAVLALSQGDPLATLRLNPLFGAAGLLLLAWTPVSWALWLGRLPRPRAGFAGTRARVLTGLVVVAALLANWAFLVASGR